MSKTIKHIFIHHAIPEWGVTPSVSSAAPIAASGAEIKSTKDVSNGMYTVLRKLKQDEELLTAVRKAVAEAKHEQADKAFHSGTFFRNRTRTQRSSPVTFVARKGR